MDIGLIGLGNMGAGIAKSLLRAGHRVVVYNRTQSRAEALRGDGAIVATTPADACRGEVVLTMLADDYALELLVFGPLGILASLSPDSIHVSSGTISVALSDRLASEHTKAGQKFVAAPVFGRPDAAEAAKLVVVAAGPSDALARCKPIFDAIGPKLLVIGEKQSLANVVKLSGNFLIACVLESLSEAIAFARKSGIDAATLVDFLTSTLFNAPVYKTYGGLIVEGNYDQVGFALPLGRVCDRRRCDRANRESPCRSCHSLFGCEREIPTEVASTTMSARIRVMGLTAATEGSPEGHQTAPYRLIIS